MLCKSKCWEYCYTPLQTRLNIISKHLIFSERKLLPEPDVKIASRSVFFDETGKRVRTNPSKENTEYVENILNDIKWLGFQWGHIYYASDYFQKLWDFAIWMIKQGNAYVDEQTAEQIAEQKGTPTTPGVASPYRDRPVEENLRLFQQMNTPEAVEGSMVLRAKLEMANPNMHFRNRAFINKKLQNLRPWCTIIP